ERRGKADESRQFRRAAPRGENAEVHFGETDLRFRVVGHHAPIAGERELASAAETCAIDRGDFDLRQFRKAMQRLLSESRVLLRLLDVRGDGEFADVSAGDEDAGLRRGDDDFLDVAGALELID